MRRVPLPTCWQCLQDQSVISPLANHLAYSGTHPQQFIAIVVEGTAFEESMAGPRAVLDVSGNNIELRRVKPVPRTFGIPAQQEPACHPRNCRKNASK